ncbi:MAG: glycosyltransferase [Coriobacteriia bacterium]|nr:glycosyltransferase [Coriobacteriia bacterium]
MTSGSTSQTTRPARILFVVEDGWACAWYRCHTPGLELMRRGHEVVMVEQPNPELFDACDVVVFQRPSRRPAVEALRRARVAGKMTVVDLDDDLWSIHPSNPAHRLWAETDRLRILEECIRTAELVTVSTPPLVPLISPMNRNVTIIQNMLPPGNWPMDLAGRREHEPLAVGWAGSGSHAQDLSILTGTVETILGAYPGIEVATAGMNDVPFRPHERLRSIQPVGLEQYASTLKQFDIGMIPLVDGRFNRCKSDLKFLEYAMMGIPSVASKVEPYEHSVEHGINGFLARNPKDWLKYLRRLIEDHELRSEMGRQARLFAQARTVDRNIGLWERAYGLSSSASPAGPPDQARQSN